MVLPDELRIARPPNGWSVMRKHKDLSLGLLIRDLRYYCVEPCDVGTVRSDVGFRGETVDSLEVLQSPREDVEILWVKRSPQGAAKDRERWGKLWRFWFRKTN